MKYSIPQSYYKTLLFKFEIQNGIGTFYFLKTLDCVRERVYDVISSMRFEHGNGYDHVHVFGLDRIALRCCCCCYCCVVVDYCCTVSTGTSFNTFSVQRKQTQLH